MVRERILVIGPSGSGKTTLAAQLAALTGLPVHHLDEIARAGADLGPETSAVARASAVAAIVESPRWISEGVHVDNWTEPLIDAADTIVWLDHVRWQRSSGRVLRRFIRGALTEARRRRGRERYLRLRDYGRKLRELMVSLPDTRAFPDEHVAQLLSGSTDKVFRCRSQAEVDHFTDRVRDEAT